MNRTLLNKSLLMMFLFILIIGGIFPAPVVRAGTAPLKSENTELLGVASVPSDFNRILWGTGVDLYENANFRGGHSAFVQVVSLKRGASVQLLHGNIVDPGIGNGVYGGDNPTIQRTPLQTAWNGFYASIPPRAFCIVNGAFFNPAMNPTHLSFPLKKDGIPVSGGGDPNPHQGKILMLEIWSDKVDIRPLTQQSFSTSDAPNILAGLAEDFLIDPTRSKGRTFVGIDNTDNDNQGTYETILIFNSDYAQQDPENHAAKVLREFGADKVIMFDGGGSTQLNCRGTKHLEGDNRKLPQTIGIVKGAYEFNSQFNGSNAGWTAVNGNWVIEQNTYSTSGYLGYFASSRRSGSYPNLTYEARMKRMGCVTCANSLIIRGYPTPLNSSFKLWNKAYYFEYTNDGYFSVWKVNNGIYAPLQNWTTSSAINQGDWNVLKVGATGSALRFYINGILVWSGADSSLANGSVGLTMYKDLFSILGNKLLVDWARLSTPFTSITSAMSQEQEQELVPVPGIEVTGGDIFQSP